MNSLKLTNSLTRKKEVFKPNNIKKISLYACGPTVYESPHVGNARTLVVFDVLFRVLKVLYNSNVMYVRNITDVDDKISLLYTSPSPRDRTRSRMPSSA